MGCIYLYLVQRALSSCCVSHSPEKIVMHFAEITDQNIFILSVDFSRIVAVLVFKQSLHSQLRRIAGSSLQQITYLIRLIGGFISQVNFKFSCVACTISARQKTQQIFSLSVAREPLLFFLVHCFHWQIDNYQEG